jgi:aspartyl-tRNA(Asn)/glutamyl-tRNA(Gln) amidotransferase subunit B
VFIEMVASGRTAADVMKAHGIEKVDESELVALCQELIAANPKIVDDIKSGKQQAAGNLIGQAKKKNPNVNPGRFRELVLELVAKM